MNRGGVIIICVLCLVFLPINGNAEVKRHNIAVGMFNTYSSGDGNLGRAEPDFKEVWEGVPGVSDYEACNMTMHYWPLPGDLPDVESNQNQYAAWWKNYMAEAYEATNQNGEVRFRVIVGSLYNYYAANKGSVFDGFIEELCRWDRDSQCAGTLAGWYLAEGPMSNNHNYDQQVYGDMVEAIKAVEDSLGVRHDMYMTTGIDSKFYSARHK